MTIKICHDKTMNNLSKSLKVISKVLQIFFLSWIPIGVYWFSVGFDSMMGTMAILFGVLLTFLFVPICRMEDDGGYQTIFHDVNKKLKLFAWNEDC